MKKAYLFFLLIITITTMARDPFSMPMEDASGVQESPLKNTITKTIQLKHVKLQHLMKILKENGVLEDYKIRLIADPQINRIILQGEEEKINDFISLLEQLDVPVPQITIQARIMNMDKKFEKSLGIAFGITDAHHLSGTLKGAHENVLQGAKEIPLTEKLNVDLPAMVDGVAQSPSVGLAFVKLGQGILLDLELSAIEAEGGGELLSSPHLITANMEPAFIEAGEEIPYEETTSGGATAVAFKKAVLGLKVIPEVLGDDTLALDIQLNQDKRGNEVVHGEPAVDTRQLSTRVIVKNGETIVLGGILEQRQGKKTVGVPGLMEIPLIGSLFKTNYVAKEEFELLIFITPQRMETL